MIQLQSPSIESIERGKQVGATTRLFADGITKWISVGFQKVGKEYLVHVNVIAEKSIASEAYELDETRAFHSLQDAIKSGEKLLSSYDINLNIGVLKGQYIFNPQAETILRDS